MPLPLPRLHLPALPWVPIPEFPWRVLLLGPPPFPSTPVFPWSPPRALLSKKLEGLPFPVLGSDLRSSGQALSRASLDSPEVTQV